MKNPELKHVETQRELDLGVKLMKKSNRFDVITFALPPFATWLKEFAVDTTRYNELLDRGGVDPSLDYLETKQPIYSAFISVLLGYYLAKSELAKTAAPHANGGVLH
jgi:hypothetical protein